MTGSRNLSHFVRHLNGGVARMELEVDDLRAGCTQAIEGDLAAIPDITLARVSLADRRVAVEWRDGKVDPVRFINRLSELGYHAHPCGEVAPRDAAPPVSGDPRGLSTLLQGLVIAVLAALAVKLLSVAMHGLGAAADTTPAHDLFPWLAAAIAIPAAAWAGRTIFVSLVRAVAAGCLSRETPIGVALVLAFGLSVSRTVGHGSPDSGVPDSYESALMLLALALAVRLLELAVQRRVPAVDDSPAARAGETVMKFVSDTELAEVPVDSVRSGDLILVRPGERIAIDGIVTEGRSEVDQSRATGETLPVSASLDSVVHVGTLNVSGTLRVRAGAVPDGGARMSGRTAPAACSAPRSDRMYAPLALAGAFAVLISRAALGAEWHDAVTAAIAVLVLTYPAAFGLAVSAVEARAARALARAGILLRSKDGIQRLARVDTILFDKTGTLTVPESEVVNTADIPPERLALAGRLALSSRHPLAAAVVRAAGATAPLDAVEEPGQGIRCIFEGLQLRFGRPSFCDAERGAAAVLETDPEASVIAFACGMERHVLAVRQQLRSDAIETVARLKQKGFAVEILSGDCAPAVDHAARTLGIEHWHAGMTPADKTGHMRALQAQGRIVLMVGDGLNDAPSLAAADAAMSVGAAGPSALAAADAVVEGDRLAPILATLAIARRAQRLWCQNLLFAAAGTAVAVLAACSGMVDPLGGALAMAGASAVVALNAARAGRTESL